MSAATELVPADPVAPAVRPAPGSADLVITDGAAALIDASLAPNTRRAYRRWWGRWTEFCERTGRTPLPGTAESLASFVAELVDEGQGTAGVGQAVAAVRSAHSLAGFEDAPAKGAATKAARAHRRQVLDTGRRTRQASPLTVDRVRALVATFDPAIPADARDHALVLLGFAACLRRSELAGLDRADAVEHRDRLTLTIRRSKTDQDGAGRSVDLPLGSNAHTCPVAAVTAWLAHLDAAGYTDGPLFRGLDRGGRPTSARLSGDAVSRIVARRADAAGLPAEQFTGHSLRAGGATSMAEAGATTREIADQGGWSPTSAVVHSYVRQREAWTRNAMRNVL